MLHSALFVIDRPTSEIFMTASDYGLIFNKHSESQPTFRDGLFFKPQYKIKNKTEMNF